MTKTITLGDQVILENGVVFKGGGNEILQSLIGSLFDQDEVSYAYKMDLMEKMGFVKTRPLSSDETFDVMIGAEELDEIDENESLPIMEVSKGKGKGFEVKQYGKKIPVSKLFRKWMESTQTLQDADSSVKKEWKRLANDVKRLYRGKIKRKNIEMINIVANGWSSANAYGAGSPTPYGQALFSASHPYLNGTETFDNTLSDYKLDETNGATVLKLAIQKHKDELRLQNGDFVDSPDMYELWVPRQLETTARIILNAGSKSDPLANNEGKLNIFTFEGSTVELKVLSTLGGTDSKGNAIGTGTMWFLVNKEMAEIAEAIRYISLYEAEIEMWYDEDKKTDYVSVDLGFAVDHYGFESFIVGSRGTLTYS